MRLWEKLNSLIDAAAPSAPFFAPSLPEHLYRVKLRKLDFKILKNYESLRFSFGLKFIKRLFKDLDIFYISWILNQIL